MRRPWLGRNYWPDKFLSYCASNLNNRNLDLLGRSIVNNLLTAALSMWRCGEQRGRGEGEPRENRDDDHRIDSLPRPRQLEVAPLATLTTGSSLRDAWSCSLINRTCHDVQAAREPPATGV